MRVEPHQPFFSSLPCAPPHRACFRARCVGARGSRTAGARPRYAFVGVSLNENAGLLLTCDPAERTPAFAEGPETAANCKIAPLSGVAYPYSGANYNTYYGTQPAALYHTSTAAHTGPSNGQSVSLISMHRTHVRILLRVRRVHDGLLRRHPRSVHSRLPHFFVPRPQVHQALSASPLGADGSATPRSFTPLLRPLVLNI